MMRTPLTTTQLVSESFRISRRLPNVDELEQQRIQATDELKQREAKYRSFFEGLGRPCFECSLDGRLREVNRAATEMLGASRAELIGANLAVLCPGFERLLDRPHARANYTGLQIEVVKRDGSRVGATVDVVPRRDPSGQLEGFQGILWLEEAHTENKETALEHEIQGMQRTLLEMARSMAFALESRDPYCSGHHWRVALLSRAIARELGRSERQQWGIQIAASLHDIGKLSVPKEILMKPGRLTHIEFGLVKTHPTIGAEFFRGIAFPWPMAELIEQHHERLDGSGYPKALSGKQILPDAFIIGLADMVEAMSTVRPHRAAYPPSKTLEVLGAQRGVTFPEVVVDACLSLFRDKRFEFPDVSILN